MNSRKTASDTIDMGVQEQRNIFHVAKWPLILYGGLAALYMYESKFSLFSYHPFFMTVGFVSLAGNATLIKKIGGYENTKTHGLLMALATIFAGIGWYIIHQNKNINHKQHLLTLHGKLGAAVVASYVSIAVFGFFALHPDYGAFKTNQTLRLGHKWGGRFLTAAAWITCVLGLVKIQQDVNVQLALGVPLLILGFFVLL